MFSMDDIRKRNLALARFNGFRNNLPDYLDDDTVAQFHEIISALEEASGEDLSSFRIPDTEMERRVISTGPLRARPGRPPIGGRRMSEKRYCDEQFMRRQIEGIASYLESLQPPPQRWKIGF
jgi:hypothetical protein